MPKTPAIFAREYRAWKKLLKQQKPPSQTVSQHKQEYTARQKALRNAVATIGENETLTNYFGLLELIRVNPDNPKLSSSRDDGNI